MSQAPRPSGTVLAPFGRHVAFGADPASQMSVSWVVPNLVKRPFVRIGTSPWDLGDRIYADLRNLTTPRSVIQFEDDQSPNDTGDIQQYFVHATINRLRPGRTYYYFVGHDGWDVAGHRTRCSTCTPATSPTPRAAAVA